MDKQKEIGKWIDTLTRIVEMMIKFNYIRVGETHFERFFIPGKNGSTLSIDAETTIDSIRFFNLQIDGDGVDIELLREDELEGKLRSDICAK